MLSTPDRHTWSARNKEIEARYRQASQHQIPFRDPPRCMYPAELKDLLWRFKAPRFVTATVVGGSLNDEKARKDLGLGSCGRIIFATGNELVESMVVPANCIPYASQRTAYWDDRQKRFTEGGLARGWLITLSSLVRDGLLIPHSKLLYLIGRPRDFARKPV